MNANATGQSGQSAPPVRPELLVAIKQGQSGADGSSPNEAALLALHPERRID